MRISLNTAEVLRLSRAKIKAKHYNHLNKWKDKLGLNEDQVLLFVYPFDGVRLARLWLEHGGRRSHLLGLSTKTLSSNDWHDSIIHELLHLIIWHATKGGRAMSMDREENLVLTLSPLLARVKETGGLRKSNRSGSAKTKRKRL